MSEAFDYISSREDANELIGEFGQTATLSRPQSGGTPANPTELPPLNYAVGLVNLSYRKDEVDGSRVLQKDRKMLVAVGPLTILSTMTAIPLLAVDPTSTDKLIVGGQTYSIQDVEPLSPGGTVVMWTIQARR